MRKNRQIKTKFGPKTRFEVQDIRPIAPRGPQEIQLEQLKARLLAPLVQPGTDPAQAAPLRLAANEAASLAWFTPFPLLFFPALFEEKIAAAQRRQARQQKIREQTEGFIQEFCE